MITLEEARARVLSDCAVLSPRRYPLAEALGLVVASDVVANELIPPFANKRCARFVWASTKSG